MKRDQRGINPTSKPGGNGCVECLESPEGWWYHLRRCAECGHIGCCDSSPGQHASRHAAATRHPIIASFEPGEDWFYDYEKQAMIEGVKLLPPHAHPKESVRGWTWRKSADRLGIAPQLAALADKMSAVRPQAFSATRQTSDNGWVAHNLSNATVARGAFTRDG